MEDKQENGECNRTTTSPEGDLKAKHASNFLPTSRRIVQFSNGKVCLYLMIKFAVVLIWLVFSYL